ncbi:MAG: hypothetical protein E7Z88_03845 [Cyanobacteria bacterium SIG27]|nr:hypothetical protein [Cyanobacteria bacterium SIG27]
MTAVQPNSVHDTIAMFHKQSFPGYDNIPKNTLNPIENFDPKAGVDRAADLVSDEAKAAIEAKNLKSDVVQFRQVANRNTVIANPESIDNVKVATKNDAVVQEAAENTKGIVKGALNSIKKHPVITAVVVAVPVVAAAVYGVKKVNENKAQKA